MLEVLSFLEPHKTLKLDNTTLKSIDNSRFDCYTLTVAGRLKLLTKIVRHSSANFHEHRHKYKYKNVSRGAYYGESSRY